MAQLDFMATELTWAGLIGVLVITAMHQLGYFDWVEARFGGYGSNLLKDCLLWIFYVALPIALGGLISFLVL